MLAQESSRFESTSWLWPFSVELYSLWVLQFTPTAQRHVVNGFRLIGDFKLVVIDIVLYY